MDISLRSELHQRGLRMTPQRQLVVDAIGELGQATPEQICNRVQHSAPSVNITTVYRTLDLLEDMGVVRHTHVGHGPPRYSTRSQQHVRLVCHNCDRVIEIVPDELAELRAALRSRYGFELDPTHVGLSGRCDQCSEPGASDST